MKKIIALFTAATLLAASITTTALAHGGRSKNQTAHSLCSVENCNTGENHNHDGTTYAGHYYGDGHDYHTTAHHSRNHR